MQMWRGSSLEELLIKAEDYPLRGSGNHVGTQIRTELSWHLGMCACPTTQYLFPENATCSLQEPTTSTTPRASSVYLPPRGGEREDIIFMRTAAIPAKFKIKQGLITLLRSALTSQWGLMSFPLHSKKQFFSPHALMAGGPCRGDLQYSGTTDVSPIPIVPLDLTSYCGGGKN